MPDVPEPRFEPEDIPAVSAEDLVDGVPAREGRPVGRRYPSTLGGICYLAVLALAVGSLVSVVWGPWRLGVQLAGVALLGGALSRGVLPTGEAGMLAVRHKAVDVSVLVLLGSVLIALARTIPDQPG